MSEFVGRLAFAGAAALVLAVPAAARDTRVGDLRPTGAWSRPTPPSAPAGAGYVTNTITGTRPDRLLSGSSAALARVEVHQMKLTDDIMRMRPMADGIVIPPGQSIALAPGGYHMMLIGPRQSFVTGNSVPVTLRFARVGAARVLFAVTVLTGCSGKSEPSPAPTQTSRSTGTAAIGGAFRLTDQNGRAVSERDLIGKPSLVSFAFTYCPQVCPTTLLHMTKWLKDLGPDGDKLDAFYVTVDPQRDTSKQLKQYLSAFDPRIRGLTGSPGQIAGIAKDYRVYYKRVSLETGDYVMDHATMVYIMNARGQFVGPIGYGEPDAQVMPPQRDLVAGRQPVSRTPNPATAVERSES
jgi:protein SCO1/2